jgi:hypothetical protein
MKKTLLCFALATCLSAVESEIQFENDKVRVIKTKVNAHEEIGLHRDELPAVVISPKGGTITRLEADGTKTEVVFPKGTAVYRPVDPIGELHRSVNNTCKTVEMIIIQLKD